jgi:hypothetical protein
VIEVKPSKQSRASTLDKYVVSFPDGDQEELWDIQLEKPSLISGSLAPPLA